jgi:Flp pilus assembly pilin Flp
MKNQLRQTKPRAKKLRHDSGATLLEYALAAGILVVVFATAGTLLVPKIKRRGNLSIESVQRDVPCYCNGAEGTAEGADCKDPNSPSYGYSSELQTDKSDFSCK